MAIPIHSEFTNQNRNFKSIQNLALETHDENIKVYLLDNISPEMLWDFWGIIPRIPRNEKDYKWPDEDKFKVIVFIPF